MAVVTIASAFLQPEANNRILMSIEAGQRKQLHRDGPWHVNGSIPITGGSITTSDGEVHSFGPGYISVTTCG